MKSSDTYRQFELDAQILKRISEQYAVSSGEFKALQRAALSLAFVVMDRQDEFATFVEDMKSNLSDEQLQQLYARYGIELTPVMLLELFRLVSHDELYAAPKSERVIQLIRQLPIEPETYEAIAEEGFRTLLTEKDEPDAAEFQKLTDILNVLLYQDGRTFTACLKIAELSNKRPAYGFYGINSLAALANYMRRGRPVPISGTELLKRLKMLERNDDLMHNAGECRKMLMTAYK